MKSLTFALLACLLMNQAIAKPFMETFVVKFVEGVPMGLFGSAAENVVGCSINGLGMTTTLI